MEFPTDMATKVTVLPIGYEGTSIAPGDAPGLTWTAKYGVVGMDVFGRPASMTDGTNTEGVYAGLLYMAGFCDYTPADGKDPSTLVSVVDVVAFLLGTCSNLDEVRAALDSVTVWPWTFGPFGTAPPAHLVLHDATGASAVVEWRAGKMVVFDNPIGVACNGPHLDWHLTNLRNHISLSPVNPAPLTIDAVQLSPLGQGPGMVGLPGDASSPSRFVRAAAYTATLEPVGNAPDAERAALHIINAFDIPWGFVRADGDSTHDDRTLWSTVSNLRDRRYILRTYDNPIPQVISLDDIDFSGSDPVQVPAPSGTFAAFDPVAGRSASAATSG